MSVRQMSSIGQMGAAVLRKNFIRTLGRDFLKPIFMVESAENGGASNHVSGRNTMSVSRLLRGRT